MEYLLPAIIGAVIGFVVGLCIGMSLKRAGNDPEETVTVDRLEYEEFKAHKEAESAENQQLARETKELQQGFKN